MVAQQVERTNPYPGPQPFKRRENLEDPGKLYGRERETYELNCLLVAERIVLLYSPSGAGKTSLVQAAIIPALQEEGFRVLPAIRMGLETSATTEVPKPANRYAYSALLSLEAARNKDSEPSPDKLGAVELDDYLDGFPSPLPHGGEQGRPGRKGPGWRGDVLIFDQFEELLTIDPTDEAGKRAFFAQVGAALQNERRWALFSMREDFIAALDPYRQAIPTALTNRYRLDLLKVPQAMEAMIGPARDSVPPVTFTPGAAKALAQNLAAKGLYVEPVQLQVVCRDLWERPRSNHGLIDESVVAQVKNVETALAEYYAGAVRSIAGGDVGREAAIREWVDTRLITPGGRRGQVLLEDEKTQGLAEATIRDLVNTHLVRGEQRGSNTWFELAHDRLIEPVRTDNEKWREKNLSEFEKQARVWNAQHRPDGLLLLGPALAAAESWAAGRTLEGYQSEFLEECRKAEAAAQLDRRRRTLIRNLAIVAAALMVVAFVLAGVAFYARAQAEERRIEAAAARDRAVVAQVEAELARSEAEQQARLARAQALTAASIAELERDPELSVLLAQTSDAIRRTAEGEDAMRRALSQLRLKGRLSLPGGGALPRGSAAPSGTTGMARVAYSPDGARLAISVPTVGAAIFDGAQPDARPAMLQLPDEAGAIMDIAFSPDGTRLATAHGSTIIDAPDYAARIWDAGSGELLHTLSGHTDWVTSVAFNQDSSQLATGSMDDFAMLWNVEDGELVGMLSGHIDDVTDVAFGPEGEVATASRDGTVRIWNGAAEEYEKPTIATLSGHDDRVLSVAFNPDGSLLASGGTDKTAILWELGWDETGTLHEGVVKARFYDHTDTVADVAFSPNGRCLVTASLDRTVRVWNVTDARQLMKLVGHQDGVVSAAFRPEDAGFDIAEAEPCGRELATTSWDGTARLWNTGPTAELATFAGHLGPVESVDYNADGSRIVSGSDDGTARVWDAATGDLLLDLRDGHEGRVNRAAYSPNGLTIATASWDGTAALWDAQTGELLQRYGTLPEIGLLRGAGHMRMRRQEFLPPVEPSGAGRDLESIRTFRAEGRALQGLAFSPNGKNLATAGDSGQVDLWDVPSDDEPETPFVALEGLYSIRFNQEGTVQVATGEGGKLYAWKTSAADDWRPYQYLSDVIYDAAFSQDGRRLVSVSWTGMAQVWTVGADGLPTEEAPLVLPGHTDRVYGVGFTPDDGQLITSGADGRALVRDAKSPGWPVIRTLYGPEFNSLDISPDGRMVAIGGEDGTVRVYTLDPDELFRLATARVTRRLTEDERAKYLPAAAPE